MNTFVKTCFLLACLPAVFGDVEIQGEGSKFIVSYKDTYNDQHIEVMNQAVQFWADALVSEVPIRVDFSSGSWFSSCSSIQNHGYTLQIKPPSFINFPNAPIANTYYPAALANSLAKTDLAPNEPDITVTINNTTLTAHYCHYWYYGLDENVPDGKFSLYYATLQELAHGLGLFSLADLSKGKKLNGKNDIYTSKVFSFKYNKPLTELSQHELKDAYLTPDGLGFRGEKSWAASENLTRGRVENTILLWSRSYASSYSVNHVASAVRPKQITSLNIGAGERGTDLTVAMLEDLGWKTTRNTAPVIEQQRAISIDEDSNYTLSLQDLTITDEDVQSLSLHVASGLHYQTNGLTLQPDANFFGTLTVPVTVSDADYQSEIFNLVVEVKAINDAPSISQQKPLVSEEDTAINLATSDFTIVDVDSNTFSLTLQAGQNYSIAGSKITPNKNFYGELKVPVVISDGAANSAPFIAKITVNAINDAPNITGQQALSTLEDSSLTLTSKQLKISDIDSTQFSVEIASGTNYSVNGQTITPAANYHGNLSVPVRVNDGALSSNSYNLTIQVSPVNDAPVITQQISLSTAEDTPLTLSPQFFTIKDVDSTQFSLNLIAGAHYQIDGNSIIPEENFTGTLKVPVTVSDGTTASATYVSQIEVTSVNDAPVINGQTTIVGTEDTEFTLSTDQFSISDADSTTFSIEVLAGSNYTNQGNKILPNANFNGRLTVSVRANDGISHSAIFNAHVDINAVNDAPVILGQKNMTFAEDSQYLLSLDDFEFSDIDSTEHALIIAGGEFYQIENNRLTPDKNYHGNLFVPVSIDDGQAASASFIAELTVTSVNDAPVLTSQNTIQLFEDEMLELSANLLNFTDVDSTQFTLAAESGKEFTIADGVLIPAPNFHGKLMVTMSVFDGEDHSNTLPVSIEILAVNDAPQLTVLSEQTIAEDSTLFVDDQVISVFDPDHTHFNLTIERGEHYQVAGNEILPEPNWFGPLTIQLSVDDGELTSNIEPLHLTVTPVNDLPLITNVELPPAQIYRQWSAQLTAEDIDGDALSYFALNIPAWLSLNDQGLLTAYPNENMIGDIDIDVAVTDGKSTTASQFTLTVLDDPSATDVQTELLIDRTIWSTHGWVPIELTLNNHGPKPDVNLVIDFSFAGQWQTQDARCDQQRNQCELNLKQSDSIHFSVQLTETGSADVTINAQHQGYEINPADNKSSQTLTFTDAEPVTPQYTVPAFGRGNVRAIGIANIQGGRWPEILFANGPTEASTSYKFDGSFFKPVLHSHLADAADSYAMAVFDFDNDGDKDWVLANGNNEANTLYRNNGDGFFEWIGSLGQYDSRAVAYGDIDGDGDKDLVFANNDQPNTLYLNSGHGEFELAAEFETRRSRRVIIHDFNGDGRPDIFFANRGFKHRILFNRGFGRARANFKATAAPVNHLNFGDYDFGDANDLASEATLADLDGDGIATDLVIANESTDTQTASLNVFSLQQENAQLIAHTQTGTVTDLSVGDYDGDGKDDIGVLRPGGALELMSHQHGQLNTIEVMDTEGADTIMLVDVDGSGQADVISANNQVEKARLDFAGEVDSRAESSVVETQNTDAAPADLGGIRVKTSHTGGLANGWLLLGLLLVFRNRIVQKKNN